MPRGLLRVHQASLTLEPDDGAVRPGGRLRRVHSSRRRICANTLLIVMRSAEGLRRPRVIRGTIGRIGELFDASARDRVVSHNADVITFLMPVAGNRRNTGRRAGTMSFVAA